MIGQPGFFDLSDRYEALSAAGDPLERQVEVGEVERFPASDGLGCVIDHPNEGVGQRVQRLAGGQHRFSEDTTISP